MLHRNIIFETTSPAQTADPARMDVACFVGLVAERPGAALPQPLREMLMRQFGASEAALELPGRLLNRPVTVTSVEAFEALFAAEARLEARAEVTGGALPAALPGAGVEPALHVVIDGLIREIPLAPLPLTPQALADRVAAAGLGLEAAISEGPALRISLPAAHGPGTLAVLPHPAYGFPETRRARARAIPTAMGQAVRQFFAMGGRKAVIVRMGDPVPYAARRAERLAALVRVLVRSPGTSATDAGTAQTALLSDLPPPTVEAPQRYGPTHAYGLEDTTFLLLPDLPELTAPPPSLAPLPPEPAAPRAVFAECLPAAGSLSDAAQSAFGAPEADELGLALWRTALERVLGMLRSHLRDKIVLAALPRMAPGITLPEIPRSAFLQLAEGWVRTPLSETAPGRLMAPDAVLAGHLANATLIRGTWLSAAAQPVAGLRDIEPGRAPSGLPTCRLFRDRGGFRLTGDLTTAEDPSWTDGPVSRLMAMLLRQAREIGEDLVFEPSNEALWAAVETALRGTLDVVYRAGALVGTGEGDSYTVRCDRSTMTPRDLDEGRLIAEVSFRPVVPIALIRVRLPLSGATGQAALAGGPQ
ncbi:hypothetical protein [Poseidonocella sp. HB161398]|uniref:hypothetical protein n=1 Tax=Poseidonocella sp. HB161398 TaxID=2320855 RepID=UPI001107FD80|nr:hypothetical protein [Poseidonocella sp. HB161398]